jgi:hypothetical protein
LNSKYCNFFINIYRTAQDKFELVEAENTPQTKEDPATVQKRKKAEDAKEEQHLKVQDPVQWFNTSYSTTEHVTNAQKHFFKAISTLVSSLHLRQKLDQLHQELLKTQT